MALQMAFTDDYGNSNASSYWRILRLLIDLKNRMGIVNFYGYKDKAAFLAGKQHIGMFELLVAENEFVQILTGYEAGQTDLFALAYERALTKDFFADATSVL